MRLRAGRKASEAAPSSDYVPSVMVRQAEGFVQQRGVCVCVCVCVCVWQRCFTFYCSFLEQLAIILHCSDVLLSKANQHVGSVKWVATF